MATFYLFNVLLVTLAPGVSVSSAFLIISFCRFDLYRLCHDLVFNFWYDEVCVRDRSAELLEFPPRFQRLGPDSISCSVNCLAHDLFKVLKLLNLHDALPGLPFRHNPFLFLKLSASDFDSFHLVIESARSLKGVAVLVGLRLHVLHSAVCVIRCVGLVRVEVGSLPSIVLGLRLTVAFCLRVLHYALVETRD